MIRFVELCVEMRKGRVAKEGLMQYKNTAQNTSVGSIEVVIQKFVSLADSKLQEAHEKAEKAAADAAADVDDLEATETPESILLGAVSGDQSRDRTDRALVTPWLKFLWESYRTALETLKNNARLQVIYHQIAQQAFQFCLKHQRKVEFRRLCETLRLHLSNVAKYAHQSHAINLQDPDTLQHYLDARFAQLNASVELELWQEAFRSVEDVHNLLIMAKKAPRPAMMANYYEKLTKIFLMSGNALYHAAAWGKFYAVTISIGGKSEEELGRLAGQVLVSALAVPDNQKAAESVEEVKGRTGRLTSLLGLSKTPTRTGLLKDALSRNVLKLASENIRSLYNILEVTFDPLTLCVEVAPLFRALSEDTYAPYLPLLQRALLSRLISQLAQVYSSITIENLLSLLQPLRDALAGGGGDPSIYKPEQIEAYIMRGTHAGELSVRVDHASGTLEFVDDPFSGFDATHASSSSTHGIVVQPSAASLVRTRLSSIANALNHALAILEPPSVPSAEEQRTHVAALVTAADAERKALQLRRAIVARRRELLSELAARKEKEEQSRRSEESRLAKFDESRRAMEDARRREIERARAEIQQRRNEEARQLAQSLRERGNLKVDIDDVENLNTDNLMRLQVEQLEKEKREREARLRVIAKRIDHVERAYRQEERPLLAKDYELQQASDRATFEQVQKARIDSARLDHKRNLETKKRLARILPEFESRKAIILDKRGAEYERKQAAAQAKIEEEKAKRIAAVLKAREEERLHEEAVEQARREEEEAEQSRQEEEERQRAEEEAAKLEAEAEIVRNREERERQRAADLERIKLQQQREEEAARRAEERRRQPPVAVPVASAAPTAAPEGAWRRAGPPSAVAAAATPPARTPPRSESPAPSGAPSKFGRGGAAAATGWRAREAKNAAGAPPPAPSSGTHEDQQKKVENKDDGFQAPKAVWKSSRLRGQ
jgi:translation initiation factor 3 subunit A